MSFIDTEHRETCITEATFDDLEKALVAYGYEVNRTKLQITATHGGFWSTNGHYSTITVLDKGEYRECTDIETAKGYLCKPEQGLLAQIVSYAESPEKIDKEEIVNPTTEKQKSINNTMIALSIMFIIIMVVMVAVVASI